MKIFLCIGFLLFFVTFMGSVFPFDFEKDVIPSSRGDIHITFIGHGTLMISVKDFIIHIDPVSRYADYDHLPAAGIILITHEHGDHLDPGAIEKIIKEHTSLFWTDKCAAKAPHISGTVLNNGDRKRVKGISIEAVPAYNILHMRSPGNPYHPKGEGNGYILTIDDIRIYVAGDTENIPEMKELEEIDIAFIPMNLPYTMSPEMAADAARSIRPRILYPYHYGKTDPRELIGLLQNEDGIEVRIRNLQ